MTPWVKTRAAALLALLLALAATTSHPRASTAQDPAPAPAEAAGDISPEALAQIEALILEK
jgi:hypothetical protein